MVGLNRAIVTAIFYATAVLGSTYSPTKNFTVKSSLLGTLEAPTYGLFLTNNAQPYGYPWGLRTALNTNPEGDPPATGITRYYDFTAARGKVAPDGYEKDAILINGEFPGPVIEANWGDWIQVTLHNNIAGPQEGTSLHWHGIKQRETPWYDGVPSVSQCPVAPGHSFTYKFRADSYGTTWYHAHYSAQYADGLFGPMIIHGPTHAQYDVDLGPVILGDYSHRGYAEIVNGVVSATKDFNVYVPAADNSLINGKMLPYNCSLLANSSTCSGDAEYAKFRFRSGNKYRLRLINAGSADMQRFSIDGHTLQVISTDFTPIVPYETDVVSLAVGQRSDVLVHAIGRPEDSYWMRSTIASNCTNTKNRFGKAVVLYESAGTDSTPTTTSYFLPELDCGGDDLSKTQPLYAINPDPVPSSTQTIELNFTTNATGHNVFVMNDVTYRANYNDPILLLAAQQNYSYPYSPEWNVYNFGGNRTIRLVINNLYVAVHPMHLHGHNMFILSEGPGPYTASTPLMMENPTRRDTQMLRRNGHLVLQFDADNPGVWPFHCHIAWHQSMGLTLNVMERPEDMADVYDRGAYRSTNRTRGDRIEGIMRETCVAWDRWSAGNVVAQVDSGV